MNDYETLNHTTWGCKYHIVFIPKRRRKGAVSGIEEASWGSLPSTRGAEGVEDRGRAFAARSRAYVAFHSTEVCGVASGGYIKGKSAIHLARTYGERKQNFVGQHFWARGYFVNTVGRDENAIRAYIQNQEKEDQRLEQLNLWR